MTGKVCRVSGRKTENMEARLHSPSQNDLKQNIDEMQLVLDKLMIKPTAKSRTIDGDDVLVKLPPHETRKIVCPLSQDRRKILQEADQTTIDQAKAERLGRCEKAKRRKPHESRENVNIR